MVEQDMGGKVLASKDRYVFKAINAQDQKKAKEWMEGILQWRETVVKDLRTFEAERALLASNDQPTILFVEQLNRANPSLDNGGRPVFVKQILVTAGVQDQHSPELVAPHSEPLHSDHDKPKKDLFQK